MYGSVTVREWQCGSAAVCSSSACGCVRQWTRQCAAVRAHGSSVRARCARDSVRQCAWQFMAVHAAVCGSFRKCGSVCGASVVRQCAAVVHAAVCGCPEASVAVCVCSVAVCGSLHGSVCAVRTVVGTQCGRQCAAVSLVVYGSATVREW